MLNKPQQATLPLSKFWPTRIGLLCLWLISRLPFTWQLSIGKLLGKALYRLAKDRRMVADTNLRLSFPTLSDKEHTQLLKATFQENGIGLIETGMSWWINPEQFRDRVNIHGLEHYHKAKAKGRGLILLGAHHTTLDLAGSLLSLYIHDISPIYRKSKNPAFDQVMLKGRKRRFSEMLERSDMRGIINALKDNRTIWYAVDQDYGKKHSVFVPFFGTLAATIKATSRIAKLNNSPVLLFSHYRNIDGTYTLEITPTRQNIPSGDESKDASVVNTMIEAAILKKPEQYMWVHRRFKTRPEGEAAFYPKKGKRTRTRDIGNTKL